MTQQKVASAQLYTIINSTVDYTRPTIIAPAPFTMPRVLVPASAELRSSALGEPSIQNAQYYKNPTHLKYGRLLGLVK